MGITNSSLHIGDHVSNKRRVAITKKKLKTIKKSHLKLKTKVINIPELRLVVLVEAGEKEEDVRAKYLGLNNKKKRTWNQKDQELPEKI